jgi:hypothetical protein
MSGSAVELLAELAEPEVWKTIKGTSKKVQLILFLTC